MKLLGDGTLFLNILLNIVDLDAIRRHNCLICWIIMYFQIFLTR